MKESFSINFLKKQGAISQEELEVVEYGIYRIKVNLISLFITFILGLTLNMLFESIMFLLFLIPLRKYVGGYHAGNEKTCALMSFIILFISMMFIRYIPCTTVIEYSCLIISSFIIVVFAPVGNETKSLDSLERKVYRNRTRIILFVEILIYSIFRFCNRHVESKIVIIVFCVASVLLISGYIKSKLVL